MFIKCLWCYKGNSVQPQFVPSSCLNTMLANGSHVWRSLSHILAYYKVTMFLRMLFHWRFWVVHKSSQESNKNDETVHVCTVGKRPVHGWKMKEVWTMKKVYVEDSFHAWKFLSDFLVITQRAPTIFRWNGFDFSWDELKQSGRLFNERRRNRAIKELGFSRDSCLCWMKLM